MVLPCDVCGDPGLEAIENRLEVALPATAIEAISHASPSG
jgi:hypothetical protein